MTRYLPQSANDTLASIMSKKVQTLSSDAPIKNALKLMKKFAIGSIVVTSDSKIVGIITERDIVRKMSQSGGIDLTKPVIDIASKPVVTAEPSTEVWEAFTLMLKRKFRRLPVVQDKKLVGIVTERDLFKWVVRVVYEPNIPDDLAKLILQS